MKYKVGDIVKIKEHVDGFCGISGCANFNTPEMSIYVGGAYKIISINSYYTLEKAGSWSWSDCMVEYSSLVVFVNKKGEKRKLLGRLGELIFLSKKNDYKKMGKIYTERDLRDLGYKRVE